MNHSISCTYIGHATCVVGIDGTNIATDPHFGTRTLHKRRLTQLPLDPLSLPELAAVLISHVHFDHLHISSFRYISTKVPVIVPEGSWRHVGKYLANPVIELSHFASYKLPDGTEITALPAKHSSFRLCPLRKGPANSYIMKKDGVGSVFFCGDSAYGEHFREIGGLSKISLAILPIGCISPRFLMKHFHMSPEESVSAFEDLSAKHMVPIHYGTFNFSLESADTPLRLLQKALSARPDLKQNVHVLKSGETFRVPV